MQRGRQYPQILQRYLNVDMPVTHHPPLEAQFAFQYVRLGILRYFQSPWIAAAVNKSTGVVTYSTTVTGDPFIKLCKFSINLNTPATQGMRAVGQFEDVSNHIINCVTVNISTSFQWMSLIAGGWSLQWDTAIPANPNFTPSFLPWGIATSAKPYKL